MHQPRDRHAPNDMQDMILRVGGLGWHGPIPVVRAPSRSEGYGVVALPRVWGRGIPNAGYHTCAELPYASVGSTTRTVVPFPGSLSMSISPPAS